jgi:hypothetical protein
MAYQAKVYVVQRFDHDGRHGPVVAVKLTHADAHKIAKDLAPAKVTCVIADKTPEPNVGRFASHPPCK